MELFFVIGGAVLVFLFILSLMLEKNTGFSKLVNSTTANGVILAMSAGFIWLASLIVTGLFNIRQLTYPESFAVVTVIILITFAIKFVIKLIK